MKTEEEYFKDVREKRIKEDKERRLKYRKEIFEEIREWDIGKLQEEYVQTRLGRISFCSPNFGGMMWDWCKEECRFCGLEYVQGEHEDCCDDCWDKNKDKTLEELDKK